MEVRRAGGGAGHEHEQCEAEAAILNERAAAGWGAAALGVAHGFVAMPWLEGVPLCHADTTPELMGHVGRYIAAVAGPPLRYDEQAQALDRASEMLYWNVWEALGEALAERTRPLLDAVRAVAEGHAFRSYGDGRLAPHDRLAYAAFRLGQTTMCAHMSYDEVEQARLWQAAARHRALLADALNGVPTTDATPGNL